MVSKEVLILAVNKVKAKLVYLDNFPTEQINFSQSVLCCFDFSAV